MKINKIAREVTIILFVFVFINQSIVVRASEETEGIDFSKFSLCDRPVAVKLLQTYGRDCIGKWIIFSEDKDGTREEVKLSYGPGAFSKMINEKIVTIPCVYAHVSRRTYFPWIDDFIYD